MTVELVICQTHKYIMLRVTFSILDDRHLKYLLGASRDVFDSDI